MKYRYESHTVYDIEYYSIWITKHCHKVLVDNVGLQVRELVWQICDVFENKILKCVVSKGHVYILVFSPLNMAPNEIIRRVKGRSSRILSEEFSTPKKRYWGRHCWARGYSCATVGQITYEMLKEYLEYHF